VSAAQPVPVRDAVILAAGNGDRFKNPQRQSKLLHPVLGQPLILRTLETAAAAGLSALHIVLGYEAEHVKHTIEQHRIPGLSVDFIHNPDWDLENGVSALRARGICTSDRFALMMGDHLFESSVLRRLLVLAVDPRDSVLGIDTTTADPLMAAEATKVRLAGDRIVAIGKDLTTWDALDTGLFLFTPALYDALEEALEVGETTLSAGVQRLAAWGRMRAADIGSSNWCDIDTLDDVRAAESMFGAPEPEPA
jgi:1L-myo-inositol 1-phosphate cytidylyltransferase